MILTTCAACAAPLAHDAPRCVRCKLRYCNATCQHDHWRRGHKQMCKSLLRKIPPARMFSVFGENNEITLTMRLVYAQVVILGPSPTLAALCKAVSTLEDTARIARRVLGGAHPSIARIEEDLRNARAALRAREEAQPSGDA